MSSKLSIPVLSLTQGFKLARTGEGGGSVLEIHIVSVNPLNLITHIWTMMHSKRIGSVAFDDCGYS